MDYKDALRALADGKRVRVTTWDKCEYIELVCNGDRYQIVDERGVSQTFAIVVYGYVQFELYAELNPHMLGTFAWAKFEALNGKTVTRATWHKYPLVRDRNKFGAAAFSRLSKWAVINIEATDWEIVK